MPGIKFIQSQGGRKVSVQSRVECQDLCLSEANFACRSASFQASSLQCFLNEQTRASDPTAVERDEDFDYLENTCLTGETRCIGANHFVHEDSTELHNVKDAMAMPEGTFFSFCS